MIIHAEFEIIFLFRKRNFSFPAVNKVGKFRAPNSRQLHFHLFGAQDICILD